MHISLRLPLIVLPILAMAAACDSGSQAPAVPRISSARAERDVFDGKAQLTSTVEIMFDRDWKLADTNLPFESLFELQVPLADGGEKRVLIRTAEISNTNTRLVTLTANALIPEGSTLTLQRRAFDRNAEGVIEAEVSSDLDAALVVLASEALAITSESFYAEPTTAPVEDAERDPVQMRAVLEKHLEARNEREETRTAALNLYDTMPQEIVPAPKLRAALAALTGTFAEPAIASLLTGENCTERPAVAIVFQEPPDGPNLVARVTMSRAGRTVSINPFAEGERIEHLMPILAHEAIHCDDEDGIVEEVAATAFDGFLYLQLVSIFPDLAQMNTRVARELNIDAVAMINSGQRFPESAGILQSPGVEMALPMSTSPARSFAELVALAYRQIPATDSPTEPVAQDYADIIAEASGQLRGDAFDLTYLDQTISLALDPGVLAAAIVAFELTPTS